MSFAVGDRVVWGARYGRIAARGTLPDTDIPEWCNSDEHDEPLPTWDIRVR